MYTVKEVARRLGISEHTIRYYTDRGLLPIVKRDKNNNRLFDDEAINWLIGIMNLKKCGMSLKDIKLYVDLCQQGKSSVPERYDIILKQKKAAEKQLEEAQKRVDYMNRKVDYYKTLLDNDMDGANPALYKDENDNKWCL